MSDATPDAPRRSGAEAMRTALGKPLRATDKLVLLGILNYAGDGAVAWPSTQTLAECVAVSPRAVRAALGRLESSGEIRRIRVGDVTRIEVLRP